MSNRSRLDGSPGRPQSGSLVELGEVHDRAGRPDGLGPRSWIKDEADTIALGSVTDCGQAGVWSTAEAARIYAKYLRHGGRTPGNRG
jgi:hypothetical protein